MAALEPQHPSQIGFKAIKNVSKVFKTKYFEVAFDFRTGAVIRLKDRETGREWADAGHTFIMKLAVQDEQGSIVAGSPEKIFVELSFPDERKEINACVKCFDKKANRLPEAQWFNFKPLLRDNAVWMTDKMNSPVEFRDVISGGRSEIQSS
ncbi:MAG: hypothetical protein ACI3ZN_07355 [Candidatus Cryptobacteroides sp.]